MVRLLMVEDNPDDQVYFADMLKGDVGGEASRLSDELEIDFAESLHQARERLGQESYGAILLDLTLPDCEGISTFTRLKESLREEAAVVVLTGLNGRTLALEAVRAGAQDYLVKNEVDALTLQRAISLALERVQQRSTVSAGGERFGAHLIQSDQPCMLVDKESGQVLLANPPAIEALGATDLSQLLTCSLDLSQLDAGVVNLDLDQRLRLRVRRTDALWRDKLAHLLELTEVVRDDSGPLLLLGSQPASRFEGMRTASSAMRSVFDTCLRIAKTTAPVLILGETGTGKELLARAIHKRSDRKGRFVALNCGAVPEHLVESELFGHERGSFTGAHKSKPGLFRHANEGTLFLDELGNLPLPAQLSLLRAIQEGAVRPVGGSREVPVDVRIIAATSVPLFDAVERDEFREDLLYRLDVMRIEVPPLRDRPEDVLHLYKLFCKEISARYEMNPPEVGRGFLEAMIGYSWPGNVRQLENFTERLLLAGTGTHVTGRDFHDLVRPYRVSGSGHHGRGAAAPPPAAAPVSRYPTPAPGYPPPAQPQPAPAAPPVAHHHPPQPAPQPAPPVPVEAHAPTGYVQPQPGTYLPNGTTGAVAIAPNRPLADPTRAGERLAFLGTDGTRLWTAPPVDIREDLQSFLEQQERAYLECVLEDRQGRVGVSAEIAGINRRTLLRKLKKHEIDRKQFK